MTELSDMIRAMADARLQATDPVARRARHGQDSGILALHPTPRPAPAGDAEVGRPRTAR